MFDIAKRRGSGFSPMRPTIKNEFALAIIWTEAAMDRVRMDVTYYYDANGWYLPTKLLPQAIYQPFALPLYNIVTSKLGTGEIKVM